MPASRQPGFDPIAEARRQWTSHGWGAAAPGMAAVTSIFRAQQIYLAMIDETLRPFKLTFARYEVLMVLSFSRRGALPLNRVGSRLQVHPTSVTNAVDRLESQRLIRRVPHPTDRRTTLAEILPDGRALALDATRAINRAVFDDPHLGTADVDRLVEVLARLRRSAGDFADDAAPGVKETGVLETGVKHTGVKHTGVRDTGVRDTGVRDTDDDGEE